MLRHHRCMAWSLEFNISFLCYHHHHQYHYHPHHGCAWRRYRHVSRDMSRHGTFGHRRASTIYRISIMKVVDMQFHMSMHLLRVMDGKATRMAATSLSTATTIFCGSTIGNTTLCVCRVYHNCIFMERKLCNLTPIGFPARHGCIRIVFQIIRIRDECGELVYIYI